ncbi:MAG: hypothetical protein A2Y20_06765 [Firmicutes bacterium GWF2_51_9]|nr:sulfite exporter TauE/SafE family protein [Erysipelotrichaceae bacterium]OGS54414.1 MAG: hypothetical protein A2Y20_06765 [Firmicutes bacterium GWF2_51_9]OGS58931.1 MAG: hypothetical protein A2Y19_07065 [Firmicutes bacterium GWE2_51_13]HAM63225.1 hypothetical protein [Erysipelotrichaceae bacterium]HBZ40505.1 hypothetical protein [Erysipelotrichaceae bacterium]
MNEVSYLLGTAAFIGTVHTVIGVDHYLPFVALSKANTWTMRKTMIVVFVCGVGHVLSSVLLGFAGIALSASLSTLVDLESVRASLATYFLIGFGLLYTLWALRNLYKHKEHTHTVDGRIIVHDHHETASVEDHLKSQKKSQTTIWGLFILFVLGPCEPLIPILMYPAATQNVGALLLVTVTFTVCTIGTMLAMTYVLLKGMDIVKLSGLHEYSHALAGSAVALCGILMLTLGI